ncbi:MAG TPA: hypothetical protein DHV26_10385 [Cytophagales bacterium]|mgnify:CR=1 FL=1|nr:hypothetical protein [Cytophagales bacterium]
MTVGSFYFRLTTSGNLLGEFSNNGSTENSTESAERKIPAGNSFVGEFYASWQEDGKAFYADLEITPKTQTANMFTLTWMRDNKQVFWGQGFLAEGLLIGNYQDQPIP